MRAFVVSSSIACFAFFACLCINNAACALLSVVIPDRLETALTSILVQLTYVHLQRVGAVVLTISIFIFYGCVQATLWYIVSGFWEQLLRRFQTVLIGLLGNVFLEYMQVSSGGGTAS